MPQSRVRMEPSEEVFDETAALMALGIPRIPAKIAIALLLSDTGRLTTIDLTQRLAVSPAAISSGIKLLNTAGIVHVGTIRGGRRYVYQLVADHPGSQQPWTGQQLSPASPQRCVRQAPLPNRPHDNSSLPRHTSTPDSPLSETVRPTTNRKSPLEATRTLLAAPHRWNPASRTQRSFRPPQHRHFDLRMHAGYGEP